MASLLIGNHEIEYSLVDGRVMRFVAEGEVKYDEKNQSFTTEFANNLIVFVRRNANLKRYEFGDWLIRRADLPTLKAYKKQLDQIQELTKNGISDSRFNEWINDQDYSSITTPPVIGTDYAMVGPCYGADWWENLLSLCIDNGLVDKTIDSDEYIFTWNNE